MTQTYTERFAGLVTDIAAIIKARKTADSLRFAYEGIGYDLADRTQRMALIERVADDYVAAHADVNQAALGTWRERGGKGERPSPITLDTALLERLADAILDEELTDNTAWKTRHSEYPFLSEAQLTRRTDGTRQRKYEGDSGEASLSSVANVGTDGRNYSVPKRRVRSDRENAFMDEGVRTRNRERKARYAEFTGVQPVVCYTLSPEELRQIR